MIIGEKYMNKSNENKSILSSEQRTVLFKSLRERFEGNMNRHPDLDWLKIQEKLDNKPEKLKVINEMERTGGEPDVVAFDGMTGEFIFYDCSPETPSGRRNLCYDNEALNSRKKYPPKGSAMGMASDMGIEIMTEAQYRELQRIGDFDTKTSSWLITPPEIRILGGAIFGDRRYNKVFVYHNGADSYYAVRGFRGSLRV
jgi:hypothetical protein